MKFFKHLSKTVTFSHKKIYSMLLPAFLLFHNSIDFSYNGARRCYKDCLSYFVTNFADEMEDKRGLRMINHLGCMDCKIHSIGFQWQVEASVSVPQARLLILELMDAFLVRINSFKRLQPFLDHCPWTVCNLSEFRIDFVDDCYYHYPTPGTLSNVTYMDGIITYNVENPRCLGETQKLRDESYYDALQFVGWFVGRKHYNSLLNPMPPPGNFEDTADWLLTEAADFYHLKKRLYDIEHGPMADIVTSPSISIVNITGTSNQGIDAFSLTPVANPFGAPGQKAPGQPGQGIPAQALAQNTLNPASLSPIGTTDSNFYGGYGGGYPYGAGYPYNNNLRNRLTPGYNSFDNSMFNETRFGQENPFNARQTMYNPTAGSFPRAGGFRR